MLMKHHAFQNEKAARAKRTTPDENTAPGSDMPASTETPLHTQKRTKTIPDSRTDHDSFGIIEPHEHDVIVGSGGLNNCHPGNVYFISLIGDNQELYHTLATEKHQRLLSKSIVLAITSLNHQGRFLGKDMSTGFWFDMGEARAIEMTTKALESKKNKHSSDTRDKQVPVATSRTSRGNLKKDYPGSPALEVIDSSDGDSSGLDDKLFT